MMRQLVWKKCSLLWKMRPAKVDFPVLISHQGHHFHLLPERALFLPEHHSLVLSDVHLGKAVTFQQHGLPIPSGDDKKDLSRISHLISKTQAKRLIIAGDLLHSPLGNVSELVSSWLSKLTVETTLVMGNHDARARSNTLPLEIVDSRELGILTILHDPDDAVEGFTLCGHLHPAVRIKDSPRSMIRSECFWVRENSLVLPSFGSFTGGQVVKPGKSDRIFIPLNGRIVEIPGDRVS